MNTQKPTVGTIVRTIGAFVVAINMVLPQFGFDPLPFDEGSITATAESVVSGVVILWAWWKNNSFTQVAIQSDLERK